jgi:hypothetical protein
MKTREIEDIKRVVSGMSTDTGPLNQVPNSYRFALNMMLESKEGDYASLTNEEGNEICFQLESNEKLIGTILINNNDTVLFIATEDSSVSKISIINDKCELTNLITASCLNFNKSYPIHGTFRIINGCERKIYFTDNFNQVRSINLDNLAQYTARVGNTKEDQILDANTNDNWECDLFAHTPCYNIPRIFLEKVIENDGDLPVGSYAFSLRYLDADFNATNWIPITNKVNIGTIAVADSGFHLNNNSGGNLDLFSLVNSNQSIQLNITELDTRYPRFELGVVQYSTSLGEVTEVYTVPSYSIEGSSKLIKLSGNETKTPVLSDEILIPTQTFNRVGSIEQLDNRLVFANTSDDTKDWSKFQRFASKIKTEWITKDISKMQVNDDGTGLQQDASTGYYSYYHMGFQRDEIYALGIVYVFKDGTESPVFHIPGRAADQFEPNLGGLSGAILQGNTQDHTRNQVPQTVAGSPYPFIAWDKFPMVVVPDGAITNALIHVEESNVLHIPENEFTIFSGNYVGSTIERWKIYNTAINFELPADLNDRLGGFGELSYYEGDTPYPEIFDCNGDSIWGEDYFGNPLVGTPVRHHKMPDMQTTMIDDGLFIDNFSNQRKVYPLGLKFSNIEYPTEFVGDIQGFYVVRVERDSGTSTVLDTGYLGGCAYTNFTTNELEERSLLTFNNTSIGAFTGDPEKDNTVHSFLCPRVHFRRDLQPTGYLKIDHLVTTNYSGFTKRLQVTSKTLAPDNSVFRPIESYLYMDKDSYQVSHPGYPFAIKNQSVNADLFSMVLQPLVTQLPSDTYYECCVKQWTKPYENLFNLTYVKIDNNIVYHPGGILDNIDIWGGDVFISEVTGRHISATFGGGINQPYENFGSLHENFYCSSIINSELRMSGSGINETHWRNYGGTAQDFLNEGDIERTNPNAPEAKSKYSLEYVVENRDMSVPNNLNKYFPLNESYDYCSECEEEFPTRIWYSERAYQETRNDFYTQFLVNNFRDLIADEGEITHLFVYKDQLYAQTPEVTWFVSTRPQQLQTNEGTISVGTGDVLSIPPKRLETVDRGYSGNQHKFSNTVCEYGVLWVDAEAGKVFLFNSQLSEISAKGMRNWFRENLPLKGGVNDQVEGFNVTSHPHKSGIGYMGTYDPKHNRYILSKKYYRIIDQPFLNSLVSTEDYVEGVFNGYNTTTGEFYTYQLGGSVVIEDIADNPNLCEDLSWTMSYSLNNQAWASYHSYRPHWLWHDRTDLYTYINDDNFSVDSRAGYKHHSRKYGEFYGNLHPSTLYLIFNKAPNQVKLFNNVEIVCKSEKVEPILYQGQPIGEDLVELENDSWDKIYLHTGRQSTGVLDLEVKNNLDESNPFISVSNALNRIRIQNNEG